MMVDIGGGSCSGEMRKETQRRLRGQIIQRRAIHECCMFYIVL